MDVLYTIDLKNYDETMRRDYRSSVRAIIMVDNKLAMVHSKRDKCYMFPGGGIEPGESYATALMREVKEETGLNVLEDSIEEFGIIREIKLSRKYPDIIYDHKAYSFFAKVGDAIGQQELDPKEALEEYELVFIAPQDALYYNIKVRDKNYSIMREIKLLEILIERDLV